MYKGIETRAKFDKIRYANCWEDPELLLEGFDNGKKYISASSTYLNLHKRKRHEGRLFRFGQPRHPPIPRNEAQRVRHPAGLQPHTGPCRTAGKPVAV